MFENEPILDDECINAIKSGLCYPPEGYKLLDDKIVQKTEDEILADDWNASVERKCEYIDYLEWKIKKMEDYLKDTDWYALRKSETDKDIPEDIHKLRCEYREKISLFRSLLTNSKIA